MLVVVVAAYFAVGLALAVPIHGAATGALQTALDVAMLAIYTWAVLRLFGHEARFVQTLIALGGCGVILGVVALPIIYVLHSSQAQGTANLPATLGYLSLIGWLVVVYGHIYRHALSRPFAVGVAVSLGYLVLSAMLMQSILPTPPAG